MNAVLPIDGRAAIITRLHAFNPPIVLSKELYQVDNHSSISPVSCIREKWSKSDSESSHKVIISHCLLLAVTHCIISEAVFTASSGSKVTSFHKSVILCQASVKDLISALSATIFAYASALDAVGVSFIILPRYEPHPTRSSVLFALS